VTAPHAIEISRFLIEYGFNCRMDHHQVYAHQLTAGQCRARANLIRRSIGARCDTALRVQLLHIAARYEELAEGIDRINSDGDQHWVASELEL
jgi:hypothetical protein